MTQSPRELKELENEVSDVEMLGNGREVLVAVSSACATRQCGADTHDAESEPDGPQRLSTTGTVDPIDRKTVLLELINPTMKLHTALQAKIQMRTQSTRSSSIRPEINRETVPISTPTYVRVSVCEFTMRAHSSTTQLAM